MLIIWSNTLKNLLITNRTGDVDEQFRKLTRRMATCTEEQQRHTINTMKLTKCERFYVLGAQEHRKRWATSIAGEPLQLHAKKLHQKQLLSIVANATSYQLSY